MNKKRLKFTVLLSLLSISCYSQELLDITNYQKAIITVYIQSIVTGAIFALITIGIVSIINYDLIDERIRKQRDVLKRRITFFVVLLLAPFLWIFVTTTVMANDVSNTIMGFTWSEADSWIGQEVTAAYFNSTINTALSYLVFFILISWIFTKFGKYKGFTVLKSNHKILGIISFNKKNK